MESNKIQISTQTKKKKYELQDERRSSSAKQMQHAQINYRMSRTHLMPAQPRSCVH